MFMVLNILLKSKINISYCTFYFSEIIPSSAKLIMAVFIALIKLFGGCHITVIDIKRCTLSYISGQLNYSWNHLASGSIHCFITILDN